MTVLAVYQMEKAGRFIEVTKVKCLPLEHEGVEKSRGGKITRTRNHSTLGLIEAMGAITTVMASLHERCSLQSEGTRS